MLLECAWTWTPPAALQPPCTWPYPDPPSLASYPQAHWRPAPDATAPGTRSIANAGHGGFECGLELTSTPHSRIRVALVGDYVTGPGPGQAYVYAGGGTNDSYDLAVSAHVKVNGVDAGWSSGEVADLLAAPSIGVREDGAILVGGRVVMHVPKTFLVSTINVYSRPAAAGSSLIVSGYEFAGPGTPTYTQYSFGRFERRHCRGAVDMVSDGSWLTTAQRIWWYTDVGAQVRAEDTQFVRQGGTVISSQTAGVWTEPYLWNNGAGVQLDLPQPHQFPYRIAGGAAGRLRRLRGGVEVLSAAKRLHRRLAGSVYWTTIGEETTLDAPLLLTAIGRQDIVVALDETAAVTDDLGTSWTTEVPRSALAAGPASWPREALGDACTDEAAGLQLATMLSGDTVVALLGDGQQVTVAEVPHGWRSQPVLARDGGQWVLGIVAAGRWRQWRAESDAGSWWLDQDHQLGGDLAWACAAWWIGRSGQHGLVGYDGLAKTVQVLGRPSYASAWSAPVTVASVSADVAPYILELIDGRWEIGWRSVTGTWSRYRAVRVEGPWS